MAKSGIKSPLLAINLTLAPPDLPRPFEEIAILIFRMPGLSSSPCNGFSSNEVMSLFKSDFIERCLFIKDFTDFSNPEVVFTSKFI